MNDFLARVVNLALNHGVGVMMEPLSNDHAVPMCDPATKRILLNSAWWNPREMAFQCAHELSHILNGDSVALYYTPSKLGIEGEANRSAVDLLVPMYFAGVEPEDANLERFMDDLAIPYWLNDHAQGAIVDYYHQGMAVNY